MEVRAGLRGGGGQARRGGYLVPFEIPAKVVVRADTEPGVPGTHELVSAGTMRLSNVEAVGDPHNASVRYGVPPMRVDEDDSDDVSRSFDMAVRNEVHASIGGHLVQAGVIHGDVHIHSSRDLTVVPRQLPAAPRWFTGRAPELDALTAALGGSTETGTTLVISAIGGAGGIGKTWLALQWAHRHVERFPDGQLFVDLRGFAPAGEPMPSADAVRGFLDALGVDPAGIPIDLDAQVGLYRSLIAGRKMLILLDNARDTAQVAPLLPGHSDCTVLVTSRRHLAGLVSGHGAQSLDLSVLTDTEAHRLLADRIGSDRMADEPDAVAELLACCGGLPLALSIVVARATMHPDFPLSVLAEELRDHAGRLDGLDAGEIPLSLRAVFSSSYHALTAEAAILFGLLGVAPGPNTSLAAAASLTALSVPRTRGLLRELETAHLIAQPIPGRYRMHDLIRLFAAEQADHQPDDIRADALRRIADYYLHTAHAGQCLLDSHRPPIDIAPLVDGCRPHRPADQAAALAWFDIEHSCLLATQHMAAGRGWRVTVWQLAWSMDTFHFRRGHLHDRLTAWQVALAAAERDNEVSTLLRAHRNVGNASARVGKYADALEHLNIALDLAQASGDVFAQAHTHYALAVAWEQQGNDERALDHATSTLHIYQGLDHPAQEADTRNLVGWYSARLGDHQQARVHCEAALALSRHHDYRDGEAGALNSLGYVDHRIGQFDEALDRYQRAIVIYRELGHSFEEANTLERLGRTHADCDDYDKARRAWQQALLLFQTQHRMVDANRLQDQLDRLNG